MNFDNLMLPISCLASVAPQNATISQLVTSTLPENKSRMENYQIIQRLSKPVWINPKIELKSVVKGFLSLGDNWDGYGATPLDIQVVINAARLIDALPDSVVTDLTKQSITPTPYGTIVFDWESGNELVSLEIGKTQIGFYSQFADGNNIELETTWFNHNNLPFELIKALNKLYQETAI